MLNFHRSLFQQEESKEENEKEKCSTSPYMLTTEKNIHRHNKAYQQWKYCRCCGYYNYIGDFSKRIQNFGLKNMRTQPATGPGRQSFDIDLQRVDKISIESLCRRCAKKTLFPFMMGWQNSENIRELSSKTSIEA